MQLTILLRASIVLALVVAAAWLLGVKRGPERQYGWVTAQLASLQRKQREKRLPAHRRAIAKRRMGDDFRKSVTNLDLHLDGVENLEGALSKKSQTHRLAGWLERWFETHGSYLKYYKSKDRDTLLAAIDLRLAIKVEYEKGERVMELLLQDRQIKLRGKNASEAARWAEGLQKRIRSLHTLYDVQAQLPAAVSGVTVVTAEEQSKLEAGIKEFRALAAETIEEWQDKSELCREVRDTDRGVSRFLWARNLEAQKAFDMFAKAVRWRHEHKLDTMLQEPFTRVNVIKPVFTGAFHGYDKLGRPMYIEYTGQMDVNTILEHTSFDEIVKYHLHTTEFLRKYLFARGSARAARNNVTGTPKVDQIVTILNLKGLGAKHIRKDVFRFIKNITTIDQDNLPELLGKCFVVNAGRFFGVAWNLIKPWLTERIVSKISINSGPATEQLLQLVDADQLPAELGGSCSCSGGCMFRSKQMSDYMDLCQHGEAAYIEATGEHPSFPGKLEPDTGKKGSTKGKAKASPRTGKV